MTAAVQARRAAERLLATVRVRLAWVCCRGSWVGPVRVQEQTDGPREGYAYDPAGGQCWCPALWRPYHPANKQAA
jgi:hypothetical protein